MRKSKLIFLLLFSKTLQAGGLPVFDTQRIADTIRETLYVAIAINDIKKELKNGEKYTGELQSISELQNEIKGLSSELSGIKDSVQGLTKTDIKKVKVLSEHIKKTMKYLKPLNNILAKYALNPKIGVLELALQALREKRQRERDNLMLKLRLLKEESDLEEKVHELRNKQAQKIRDQADYDNYLDGLRKKESKSLYRMN